MTTESPPRGRTGWATVLAVLLAPLPLLGLGFGVAALLSWRETMLALRRNNSPNPVAEAGLIRLGLLLTAIGCGLLSSALVAVWLVVSVAADGLAGCP